MPLSWRLSGGAGLRSSPGKHAGACRPDTLPPDHPAWSLEARYLALGVVTFICILMPQRIIIGGGILHQEHLFPRVRYEVQQLLNNYIQVSELHARLDHYIVPPALGDQAGVLGTPWRWRTQCRKSELLELLGAALTQETEYGTAGRQSGAD